MRSTIAKNFHYTGDYYGYTRTLNEDGITYTYSYFLTRKVKMALSVNLLGELVITSPEKMQINGKLKNVVDRAGIEIYTNGEWTISQTAPLLGPLGTKDGYQYKAALTAGNI